MTEQINRSYRPFETLNQDFTENNELNCAKSKFSKHETRNRLLGADVATDQKHSTLTFLREKSSEATSEEE